jgi:hypothetical protein
MKAIMKMKKNKAVLSRFSQIQMEIQSIKAAEEKSDNRKTNKKSLQSSGL